MQVTDKKPAFTSDTLMGELRNWNRQEQNFKNIFSEEALKDRDFQKMKLREYTKISLRYSGIIRSTDEKALFKMLQFQQKKMEKALFPGLLRRVLNRIWRNAICSVSSKAVRQPRTIGVNYIENSIVPPAQKSIKREEVNQKDKDFKKIQGYDLGARVKPDPEKRKSQGI